jgi:hypothetical protein
MCPLSNEYRGPNGQPKTPPKTPKATTTFLPLLGAMMAPMKMKSATGSSLSRIAGANPYGLIILRRRCSLLKLRE